MTVDANETVADEQVPPTDPPREPPAGATARRGWSAPKSPVTRRQVDDAGRAVVAAAAALGRAVAAVVRYLARAVAQLWRAIDGAPPALQLLSVFGVLMLLGIVGSIALAGTAGLVCAVVVVPVCSVAVGALGHRWFGNSDGAPAAAPVTHPTDTSELQRSVVYVDRKLSVALESLGSQRHQQAVIALFQAKTAAELALGTEQDSATHIAEPVPIDEYGLRPRIQAGATSKTTSKNTLTDGDSQAAS